MTFARRPAGVALGLLVCLGVSAYVATSARADSSTTSARAAELLQRTRTAPAQHDFEGEATVTWATRGKVQRARVHVTDVAGAVEIRAVDGNTVVDEGRRTYLHDRLGWTGVVIEPSPQALPKASTDWKLSLAGSRTVAGRPTTVVEVARRRGTPAQRVAVDDATGLLLAREVLGPRGDVERSVRFDDIEVGAPTGVVSTPSGVANPTAPSLPSTPDGYRAPASPAGFDLVTRSRHPDGVLLFYSDGVFTASVFEQRGDLDWDALPDGGRQSQLADTRTRIYDEASGAVAVWERDGLVYTCVTDAPSDRFDAMVGALAAGDRSVPESIVDFVLGPFGWS